MKKGFRAETGISQMPPQICFLLFSLSENFLILDSLIPQDLTGWQEYNFGPSGSQPGNILMKAF